MSDYIVHWAGTTVRHRSILRCRCMWCGALLTEIDVDRVAWQDPDGKTPAVTS